MMKIVEIQKLIMIVMMKIIEIRKMLMVVMIIKIIREEIEAVIAPMKNHHQTYHLQKKEFQQISEMEMMQKREEEEKIVVLVMKKKE